MAVPIPGDIDDLNPNIPTINDQLAEAYKWFQYLQQVLINSQKTWPQSDNSDHAASTNYVQVALTAASLSGQIPSQAGNAGKVLGTDGTTASWVKGGIITPVSVTANYTVSGANANSNKTDLLRLSGTFTLSFPAPSTLGSGFFLYARNEGTGDVTISPTGTVDGIASFIMYPAETRLFYTDGTNLFSLALTPFKKTWTSSGTHADPPGYVELQGLPRGGGAGSGTSTGATIFGCGGGGSMLAKLPAYTPGSTRSVLVGQGGLVGAGTTGNAGGSSSIGAITGGGGSPGTTVVGGTGGGTSAYADTAGGAAGVSSIYGGGGGATSGVGGSSVYGGGGGSVTGAGGLSRFGGAGSIINGTGGVYPSGGGGAASGAGASGGPGAAGNVEIFGVL